MNITAGTTISKIRIELKETTASLSSSMSNAFTMLKCKGTSPTVASSLTEYTRKRLNSIEEDLVYAQKTANAFAGISTRPSAETIRFNIETNSSRYQLFMNGEVTADYAGTAAYVFGRLSSRGT